MKKIQWVALPLFILLFLSSTVFAQRPTEFLEYHPLSPVSIGKGVNRNFPLIEHNNCLNYQSVRATDSSGAREVKFEFYLAHNTKSLQKALGISGEIQAQAKFFGKKGKLLQKALGSRGALGASANYVHNETLNDTSIALVIKATADYGRFEVQSDNHNPSAPFRLHPQFQQLIDAGEHQRFSEQCGTHFVVRETRKGMVSAVIQIDDLTMEQKTKIAARIFAGQDPNNHNRRPAPVAPRGPNNNPDGLPQQALPGSGYWPIGINPPGARIPQQQSQWGGRQFYMQTLQKNTGDPLKAVNANQEAGLQFSASLDEFLHELNQSSKKHSIRFHALGGGGLSALEGLLNHDAENQSLSAIQRGFAAYLRSFDLQAENARTIPAIYQLASMEMFGFQPDDFQINRFLLETIYYEYTQIQSNLNKINEILNNPRTHRYSHDLNQLKAQYQGNLTILWDMAQKVLKGDLSLSQDDIPHRDQLNLLSYQVSVETHKNSFECQVTGQMRCGDRRGFFTPRSHTWNAYFLIAGQVLNMENMALLEVWAGDRILPKQRLVQSSVPSRNTHLSIDNNGYFKIRFARYNPQHEVEAYHQILANLPYLYLKVVDTEGNEETLELGQAQAKGPHANFTENPNPDFTQFSSLNH